MTMEIKQMIESIKMSFLYLSGTDDLWIVQKLDHHARFQYFFTHGYPQEDILEKVFLLKYNRVGFPDHTNKLIVLIKI